MAQVKTVIPFDQENKTKVEELIDSTPYFELKALNCRCRKCRSRTGYEYVSALIVEEIIRIRTVLGVPLKITSGYRCKDHPREVVKKTPGSHNRGMAIDVNVYDSKAFLVLQEACEGEVIRRIGVNQKGGRGGRFLHLQALDAKQNASTIFSY